MDYHLFEKPKKPLFKRASYHLFNLSKRIKNRNSFNINFNEDNFGPLKSKYDTYGFALDDNQFASGIEAYEKEFEVKKERRLKRWEAVPLNDEFYDVTSDDFKIMVRKGIPDHLRSLLWRKLLGADTLENSNRGLYQKMVNTSLSKEISDQIDMDINRTFPHHRDYKVNSFGTIMLRNVLCAFANYMPSISYCQSLNYLTATLLIFMNEEEAFWSLVQIVNSRIHEKGFDLTGYYKDGMLDLKRDIMVLEFILKKRMKRLYNHLRRNNIDLMWICAEWFLCLFAISLPTNTVFRVWDSLFLEGDKVLFRVAFSLFKLNEQKILSLDSDRDLLLYCKKMSKSVLQHDEFLKVAFYQLSSFSRKEIHQYRLIADHQLESFSPPE